MRRFVLTCLLPMAWSMTPPRDQTLWTTRSLTTPTARPTGTMSETASPPAEAVLHHGELMDAMSLAMLSYSAAPLRQAFDDDLIPDNTIRSVLGTFDPAGAGRAEELARWRAKVAAMKQDGRWKVTASDRDFVPRNRFSAAIVRLIGGTKAFAASKAKKRKLEAKAQAPPDEDGSFSESSFDAYVHVTTQYPDLKVIRYIKWPFTAICVSEAARKVFVVFRGTVLDVDWMYDGASVVMRPLTEDDRRRVDLPDTIDPRVLVSYGFYRELFGRYSDLFEGDDVDESEDEEQNLYDAVAEAIRDYVNERGFELYITGHSLGGALTTLFTYVLGHDRTIRPASRVKAVAFAAPRVGCSRFKRTFERLPNVQLTRACNAEDLVTSIPFNGYFRGKRYRYSHVTQTPTVFFLSATTIGSVLSEVVNGVPLRWVMGRDVDVDVDVQPEAGGPEPGARRRTLVELLKPWRRDSDPSWRGNALRFSLFVANSAKQHAAWRYMRRVGDVPDAVKGSNMLADQ